LFTFWTQCYSGKIWLDIYYTEFLTLFWFAMLVNEYRLEIQFKKVQKIRNINNIPMVGSRPTHAQNGLYSIFKVKYSQEGCKKYCRLCFRRKLKLWLRDLYSLDRIFAESGLTIYCVSIFSVNCRCVRKDTSAGHFLTPDLRCLYRNLFFTAGGKMNHS
jgi:hypothetical protein